MVNYTWARSTLRCWLRYTPCIRRMHIYLHATQLRLSSTCVLGCETADRIFSSTVLPQIKSAFCLRPADGPASIVWRVPVGIVLSIFNNQQEIITLYRNFKVIFILLITADGCLSHALMACSIMINKANFSKGRLLSSWVVVWGVFVHTAMGRLIGPPDYLCCFIFRHVHNVYNCRRRAGNNHQ